MQVRWYNETVPDSHCIVVPVVREFWTGTESAWCRFFWGTAPCADSDVVIRARHTRQEAGDELRGQTLRGRVAFYPAQDDLVALLILEKCKVNVFLVVYVEH